MTVYLRYRAWERRGVHSVFHRHWRDKGKTRKGLGNKQTKTKVYCMLLVSPFNMSAPPMYACFDCFKSMKECHWVALNEKCVECSQIGNDNCSYLQDPGTSADPIDGSTTRELLDLHIFSGF